ncbi:hypothetical protein EYF80_022794 [Liparis tanakae]|uniref:Uncharacterized protein n=1 Tax=Liparis tanakae TaxID=230148 RepID=A0A4Z2HN98_9TELE|nr:hypothetical protein EYF80_022794 [Liparis tanakae]
MEEARAGKGSGLRGSPPFASRRSSRSILSIRSGSRSQSAPTELKAAGFESSQAACGRRSISSPSRRARPLQVFGGRLSARVKDFTQRHVVFVSVHRSALCMHACTSEVTSERWMSVETETKGCVYLTPPTTEVTYSPERSSILKTRQELTGSELQILCQGPNGIQQRVAGKHLTFH